MGALGRGGATFGARSNQPGGHQCCVAIINTSGIVGQCTLQLSSYYVSVLAEVTGNRVNRGAGYGLEIPCKYHFFGSSLYIERLKIIVDSSVLMDCCSFHCVIVIE